jgi:hypothetical protein
MAAKKFRFVSPGVKINEIDRSRVPTLPGQIGPLVIGRSVKGPTMVPVTVANYEEFVQKFGEPSAGLGSSDIWRNGNDTGPTYGAYAAQAWLASSSPLTFLRLGGVQPGSATADQAAGWQTSGTLSDTIGQNGGAYGLFLVASSSTQHITPTTGTLAAVFYADEGVVELVGTRDDDVAVDAGSGVNVFVISSGEDYQFKARVTDKTTSQQELVTFNFNKSSDKFIRKSFNTNPTLVNNSLYTTASGLKTYWLGETFEDSLDKVLPATAKTTGACYAFITPLASGSNYAGTFRKGAQPAKSGWVISQHLSADTSSFDPAVDSRKLFRIVAGEGEGSEFEQLNYKISIFDIKAPSNKYQKYGTFSIGIRNINDSDKSPEFIEVFSNLNLDPTSPNYVAARIGDRRVEWSEADGGEGRYIEVGDFENNSKIIRIEMHPTAKSLPEGVLPAGFIGPPRFKTFTFEGISGSAGDSQTAGSIVNALNATPNQAENDKIIPGTGLALSASISFPTLPLVVSASSVGFLDPADAFFGLDVGQPFNESLRDILKVKPSAFDSYDADATYLENSVAFTLDDVSSSANGGVYAAGNRKAGLSLSATNGFSGSLEAGFNKFTMPLFGGFDGLDITEREPFRNSLLANATEDNSYAYYSIKRAITSVKDPEVLDMNVMVVPGITDRKVTEQMIKTCDERADCLAIIDVEGGYVPETESTDSEKTRMGKVSEVVSAMKARDLNSSYACAYYPWVQIRDSRSGSKLWIPPSVAAFGTMASSQESSEVWFAPAGFNRGGLSEGSSGLNVVGVKDKVTSKQRDALYDVGVNPIASFPSEGIVIFGQKTLQAFPSALDRINVRRLVIFLKKEISRIAAGVLFDPNVQETWRRFTVPTNELLESVKNRLGISDYRVVLDETTTTPEEIDRNMMYAKLFIKPVYAIEFIGIDFVITNTGASFDDA